MRRIISDDELNIIEMRAKLARPGPWKSFVEGRDHFSGSSFIMTGLDDERGEDIELTGATTEDQDFIAAARQDVVKLIEEVRALKTLLAQHVGGSARSCKPNAD